MYFPYETPFSTTMQEWLNANPVYCVQAIRLNLYDQRLIYFILRLLQFLLTRQNVRARVKSVNSQAPRCQNQLKCQENPFKQLYLLCSLCSPYILLLCVRFDSPYMSYGSYCTCLPAPNSCYVGSPTVRRVVDTS